MTSAELNYYMMVCEAELLRYARRYAGASLDFRNDLMQEAHIAMAQFDLAKVRRNAHAAVKSVALGAMRRHYKRERAAQLIGSSSAFAERRTAQISHAKARRWPQRWRTPRHWVSADDVPAPTDDR